MKNLGKKHDKLMELLDQVPGVKEHMNSFEVLMGEKILKRRLELGLTQSELVELIRINGQKITQSTISKVECGDATIGTNTYNKVLDALGGLSEVKIEFGEFPKSNKKTLAYA